MSKCRAIVPEKIGTYLSLVTSLTPTANAAIAKVAAIYQSIVDSSLHRSFARISSVDIMRRGARLTMPSDVCSNTTTKPVKPMTFILTDEAGQDLIEYALLAALIAIGTLAAMRTLHNTVGNTFNTIGNSLKTARI